MLRFIIVRPGSTELDEQGRIKGSLNIPLSQYGETQVEKTADELHAESIEVFYTAPCRSAQQTAMGLSETLGGKVKVLEPLVNLDLGLWNGKLIEELKHNQPRIYKQWQEHPETVCPPNGETLETARRRVKKVIQKLIRRHRHGGVVAIIVPEPLATIVASILRSSQLGDLWKAECACGRWEGIDIEPARLAFQ